MALGIINNPTKKVESRKLAGPTMTTSEAEGSAMLGFTEDLLHNTKESLVELRIQNAQFSFITDEELDILDVEDLSRGVSEP